MGDDKSEPDEATLSAEEEEARVPHTADRPPTDDETRAADGSREQFAEDEDTVAKRYKEMAERGVNEKGEGRIQ